MIGQSQVNVAACLEGDRQAQQKLYDQFKVKMFRLCMRYASNREEAEDFLMEGFFKVFRDLHQYDPGNSLEAWIRKVMINTALMNLRKTRRFRFEPITGDEDFEDPEAAEDIFFQLTADFVLAQIQQLPDGLRTVFNLYLFEGFSHKEIARHLNIPNNTVRTQYRRARLALIKSLKAQNVI